MSAHDALHDELAAAGSRPRRVVAAVVARGRRGPARRGRHQRRDARPGAERRGPTWSPAATASSPAWRSPSWCSGTSSAGPSQVQRVAADGDRVARGDVLLSVHGPVPRPAHRRAHRAELPLPPLRGGHRDRRAGSTRWPAPAHGCATPARPRPASARWRSTPCGAAAALNHRATLSDQALVKDNHVLAAGGVVPAYERGAGPLPRPAGAGRGHHARPAPRAPRRRRRPRSCSTT